MGPQPWVFWVLPESALLLAFTFRLFFKPGLVSFSWFVCASVFPYIFWDFPWFFQLCIWVVSVVCYYFLLTSGLVSYIECFLWIIFYLKTPFYVFPMGCGWHDVWWRTTCLSGGRQTCRVLFNFSKSKAHLLKLKLAAITSFTSVKNVCSVQVITLWILTATYFL